MSSVGDGDYYSLNVRTLKQMSKQVTGLFYCSTRAPNQSSRVQINRPHIVTTYCNVTFVKMLHNFLIHTKIKPVELVLSISFKII